MLCPECEYIMTEVERFVIYDEENNADLYKIVFECPNCEHAIILPENN